MLTDSRWPVAIEIEVRFVEPTYATVPTVWAYTPRDPYAVRLDFGQRGGGVVWGFARELLRVGMHMPAGLGDVAVWPSEQVVWMALDAPQGRARFAARRRSLLRFLRTSYAWVPAGEETDFANVDAALARILEEGELC